MSDVSTCADCGTHAPKVDGSSPCGWDYRLEPYGDLCEACAGKPGSGAVCRAEPCHCCGRARHGGKPENPSEHPPPIPLEPGEVPF